MRVLTLAEIKATLSGLDLMGAIEEGFVAYSDQRAVVPPVGELTLDDPPGEVHIKYGYIRGGDTYVIKVASGFYQNADLGLPSSNGLMLVFSQATGALQSILLDEGHLTDVRTAVAGAIAAKHLAPRPVTKIGIAGTGLQAEIQLRHLAAVTSCRDVLVWGRRSVKVQALMERVAGEGCRVSAAKDPGRLVTECNLIVTTTPATDPFLHWNDSQDCTFQDHGLHITAVGSDTPQKRELGASLFTRADLVVADSRSQCQTRGEIHHALREGLVDDDSIQELGNVIAGQESGRTSTYQVTIADLTGVAVQDIQIANAVLEASSS